MTIAISRDFAGQSRLFELPPANPVRLYRGLEAEGLGNLSELAVRARDGALGAQRAERIIAHALSRGHPLTLLRMAEIVREEMRGKPLAPFLELATAIIAAAFAGTE